MRFSRSILIAVVALLVTAGTVLAQEPDEARPQIYLPAVSNPDGALQESIVDEVSVSEEDVLVQAAATNNIYTGCLLDGKIIKVKIGTSPLTACKSPEVQITWSQTGPIGPAGPVGPKGATGATGPVGPKGATGATGAVGPAGPTGAIGPQGPKGDTGATGETGPQGAMGPVGPAGPKGDTGAAGAQGPAGSQGPQGEVGPAGPAGPQGEQGEQGDAGPQGPIGLTGATGAVGPQGEVGPAGPKGDTGAVGAIGPAGATGATGTQGPEGLACWDLDADREQDANEDINQDGFYTGEDCTGEQGLAGLQGPAGPIGATGPAGPQGEVGATGPQGAAGEAGLQGDPGAIGPQGPQGVKGDAGATGAQGEKGDPGVTGPQGENGALGPAGPQGLAGADGAPGAAGPAGPQGPKGDTGAQGPQGVPGVVDLNCNDGDMTTWDEELGKWVCSPDWNGTFAGQPGSAYALQSYVNSALDNLDTTYVNVTGDTISGNLSVAGDLITTGSVQVGSTTTTCSTSKVGTLRWSSTQNQMQVCNNGAWLPIKIAKSATVSQVYFLANNNASNQFTTSSGYVIADYLTEQIDLGQNYDPNNRTFTAPLSGVYHFEVVYIYRTTSSSSLNVGLWVNNSLFAYLHSEDTIASGKVGTVNASLTVPLLSGDKVTIRTLGNLQFIVPSTFSGYLVE